MDGWLDWVLTAAGGIVVLLALRDIFHTLWHPTGRGGLSRRVMSTVWRAGRSGRRRQSGGGRSFGGPFGMVLVVVTWAALIVLGGALVHWPHLDDGFSFGSSLQRAERGEFLDALYVSLVTTATLGYGDIVPTAAWLRIVVPVQAFIGFVLLTAAVTWVLQLYPALIRRRTLAVRLASLRVVDTAAMLGSQNGTFAVQVLDGLAASFAQARVDVTQYAAIYYFRDGSQEASLPAMVTLAAELSDATTHAATLDVRLAGRLLDQAIADYLQVIDDRFLHTGGSAPDIRQAYAADHGYGDSAAGDSAAGDGRRSRK